ncbi:MBL fold metallo-hydrolase [Arsenicibacter rosenii]|uniref:Metallo-beta-lactamase domain-containing protein n=1 Tax=Arsenicibacter rosenii TaxID=1750698 RepID=A0A1S2VAY4_9BACT|nr:MBL fold metallo-hydrolase [Arsenicibacter rosenii]OIN55907.1 hypothetical protein BLX24_27540 [Arsenicibacter rosenii]
MTIIPLREGTFSVDFSKIFLPFNSETDQLADRPPKSVAVAIQPFLVCVREDIVLLDTGLGTTDAGQMTLVRLLQEAGFGPEQVTKVVLSHLHKDHANGVGYFDEHDRFTMTFPNAAYYIQKREMTFARQQESNPSYNQRLLAALEKHPQVVWLEADEGRLSEQITFLVTKGHSPFHQVVWMQDAGQTAFFGADEVPQLGYLKRNLAYKNDFDGKQGMTLRKQWAVEAAAQQWQLLLYHDIKRATTVFIA